MVSRKVDALVPSRGPDVWTARLQKRALLETALCATGRAGLGRLEPRGCGTAGERREHAVDPNIVREEVRVIG